LATPLLVIISALLLWMDGVGSAWIHIQMLLG